MSVSPLVSMTRYSPNCNSPRNHSIDTITIHCYVGQVSIEAMGNWLCNASAQASANYGIGSDGRIICLVDEANRSWCSSNAENDNRAVTIECASESVDPYAVNDKVYKSLIALCADICKRNGIKKLLWKADPTLVGHPEVQNMTAHRWFACKACPGDYLYSRFGVIADEVNKLLGVPDVSEDALYHVRKSWTDKDSQIGAYRSLDGAKSVLKAGYSIYDSSGKKVAGPAVFSVGKKYQMTKDLALRKEPNGSAAYVKYEEIPSSRRKYFRRGKNGEALIKKGTKDKCFLEHPVGNRGVYMKVTRGWILAQYKGVNRVQAV